MTLEEKKIVSYLKKINQFRSAKRIAEALGIFTTDNSKQMKKILSKMVNKGLVEFDKPCGYAWSGSEKASTFRG